MRPTQRMWRVARFFRENACPWEACCDVEATEMTAHRAGETFTLVEVDEDGGFFMQCQCGGGTWLDEAMYPEEVAA